jgi:disulfide bond formation protein DsbB
VKVTEMPDLMALSTQRALFVLGAIACAGLMATALYMQHVMELEPCPLCVFQRIFVILVGVLMLLAALHNSPGLARRVYGGLIALVGAAGVAVAGRHVWLQNLPPEQVPECGPGLEYMLQAFPLSETLSMVFRGSGECAEVQWTFLGLSIPGWTLVIFVALVLFGGFIALTRPRLAAR